MKQGPYRSGPTEPHRTPQQAVTAQQQGSNAAHQGPCDPAVVTHLHLARTRSPGRRRGASAHPDPSPVCPAGPRQPCREYAGHSNSWTPLAAAPGPPPATPFAQLQRMLSATWEPPSDLDWGQCCKTKGLFGPHAGGPANTEQRMTNIASLQGDPAPLTR